MLTYVQGSLFESPAKVLVNTVNTVGVMGKGIALEFKNVYPEMFKKYQQLCEQKLMLVGSLWLFKTSHKWILNFPTKQHWRSPSKPEYVEAGLQKFVATYADQGITSIAFPQLGCGNGELDWEGTVRPLMLRYLASLPIDVFIYEYVRTSTMPEHRDVEGVRAWLRSEPRSLAFDELWSDLRGIIGAGITLTTWDGGTPYSLFLVSRPGVGLRVQVRAKSAWTGITNLLAKVIPSRLRPLVIGPEDVFIPQEAMLELWQSIRGYGFCVPRIMPSGLDILAPYVLPLMSKLPYLLRVQLKTSSARGLGASENGLRLYAPHDQRAQPTFQASLQPA